MLPQAGRDLEWLARKCGERNGAKLMERVRGTFDSVRGAYEAVLR